MDASLLPPPPPKLPADLTRATARYRRHAWLAVVGLIVFVAAYLALIGWFSWTSYRYFYDLFGRGRGGFVTFLGGALSGLLGLFLLKALFFMKAGGTPDDLEVTPSDEPALFEFLNALADRAGAPRPHRVFLSMRVNAAVFYDLSLVNLLVPTRKNLEIGLGLVNTLNLSEMTAVLAHEFGHFAQRSMAVGRWVYMAQQVVGQIVATRGWLDKALRALSSFDPRIAWIAWIMRLIVWAIRSLLDTAFGLVILAQRALGREMEFQADLVSVSLTGSDALVHALHRLGAAGGAWDKAIRITASELVRGRAVPDLFALQTRIIERMSRILNEPGHGASPARPESEPHLFRVFEQEMAEPPPMWSTHPNNRDREDNAKRRYVAAELDARPAWCLFRDATALKRRYTAKLVKDNSDGGKYVLESEEDALAAVDRRFDRPYLDERYRGAYLGRSIVLHERSPAALYGEGFAGAVHEQLSRLYPEQLAADIRDLRQRQEESARLEALKEGLLEAPGGVIRHRGRVIQRRGLGAVLRQVTTEHEAVRQRVEEHDRLCRASHRAAARELGGGWDEYLYGLGQLLHYSGHAEANLQDARGHMANVFAVVTADGRVSSSERQRLVAAAVEVHEALGEVFVLQKRVKLGPVALERLIELLGLGEVEKPPRKWRDVLPQNYQLPEPTVENIGEWLQVIESWVTATLHALGALERVALELLVEAEALVQRAYLERGVLEPAPKAPRVPERYQTLARGEERARQRRLGFWDRFQTADGIGPSVLRFMVAGSVLLGVLGFSRLTTSTAVTLVNQRAEAIEIQLDGESVSLEPSETREVEVERHIVHLLARSRRGELLESFQVDARRAKRYVLSQDGVAASAAQP
ncbi:MAG TPA: M48 family metalloprotease [Polyangiaceae bacterium]|nr:M48 family metalloprotease [Polyangiaceae bacterium]